MKRLLGHYFCWRHTVICLLLYVFALVVRLWGITTPAPQTDEITWRKRSSQIIRVVKKEEYSKTTSHLAHPGIPPAMIMALGQLLAL